MVLPVAFVPELSWGAGLEGAETDVDASVHSSARLLQSSNGERLFADQAASIGAAVVELEVSAVLLVDRLNN